MTPIKEEGVPPGVRGHSPYTGAPSGRMHAPYTGAPGGRMHAPYTGAPGGRTHAPYTGAPGGTQQHKPQQLSERQKRVEKLLKHVADGDIEMVCVLQKTFYYN